jgi:nucleoside-diphosphate-sugar epimerase
VRPDTQIPFMVMPDAVDALVKLAGADAADLSKSVYNITAFNPTAEQIRELVVDGFPDADITFEPDLKRQAILDTWPADVDDSAARSDWGLAPRFDLQSGFSDFLIPRIRERYSGPTG